MPLAISHPSVYTSSAAAAPFGHTPPRADDHLTLSSRSARVVHAMPGGPLPFTAAWASAITLADPKHHHPRQDHFPITAFSSQPRTFYRSRAAGSSTFVFIAIALLVCLLASFSRTAPFPPVVLAVLDLAEVPCEKPQHLVSSRSLLRGARSLVRAVRGGISVQRNSDKKSLYLGRFRISEYPIHTM